MGAIVPYRPPRAREEWTAYLGMVVFLGVVGDDVRFALLRLRHGAFANHGVAAADLPELPRVLPAINTAILASSVVLQLGVRWACGVMLGFAPGLAADRGLERVSSSCSAMSRRLFDRGSHRKTGRIRRSSTRSPVFTRCTCWSASCAGVALPQRVLQVHRRALPTGAPVDDVLALRRRDHVDVYVRVSPAQKPVPAFESALNLFSRTEIAAMRRWGAPRRHETCAFSTCARHCAVP